MKQYVPARLVNDVTSPPPLPEITKRTIICGVVEGFYGRPWTSEQRKHLFGRLKRLGMSTYLYAPKDDIKHRAEWRNLYNQEETEILQDLIHSATENNVNFVYALSPGLDIMYSQQKEVDNIKNKLDQVRSLGCNSFALLFDDIETDMQEADKQRYNSFADAQVSVTNEVFQYLEGPEFYFCPTEYCETRAVPNLLDSHYLQTVGKKLIKDIHVMWTGPRVISRIISVEHIKQVARVIRRKPLIWDNLHANDYDPKRVFMGPFAGRAVSLKDEVSGLLLNPNCKYESNFVPLHTLSDWNACDADTPQIEIGSDALLEAGGASPVACLAVDSARPVNLYHPLHSLRHAIRLWIDEFNSTSGPSIPPVPRMETIGSDVLDSKSVDSSELTQSSQEQTIQLEDCIQAVERPLEDMQPINSLCADYVEPMDTRPFGIDSQDEAIEDIADELPVQEDVDAMDSDEKTTVKLTDFEQVGTLVDMFFLPFECGRRASEILEQFAWLHENAMVMADDTVPKDVLEITQAEWRRRFAAMEALVDNLKNIFRFITDCMNKPLVSEMIPYAWEAHGCCAVMLGITRWMARGNINQRPEEQPRFWNTPIEDEPWTISCGFVSNVYTLIASRSEVIHLFHNKGLLPLSIVDFVIKPLADVEQSILFTLATSDATRTEEQNQLNKDLYYDKFINPFATFDSKYSFVLEDYSALENTKLMCFGSALMDGSILNKKMPAFIKDLEEKYKAKQVTGVNMTSLVNDVVNWFPSIPPDMFLLYPSWMDVRFNVDGYEAVPAKKLIHTICAALAMNGSDGVFLTIPVEDTEKIQYFVRIGFSELGRSEDERFFILGQRLATARRTDQYSFKNE